MRPLLLLTAVVVSSVVGCFDGRVVGTPVACVSGADCQDGERCRGGRCESVDVVPGCGDGVVDDGEACDGTPDCTAQCTPVRCGDGIISDGEACDDGGQNGFDAPCLPTCELARCGDGLVRTLGDDPEQCDDGDDDELRCTARCLLNVCGDAIVGQGEVCDDGNTAGGDGCRGDCLKVEACGDGVVDEGEVCDDRNDNPWDGCLRCAGTLEEAELWIGADRLRDGAAAPFDGLAIARDEEGALLIGDTRGVFRVADDGTLERLAGGGPTPPRTGLLAVEVDLGFINAITVDRFGRLWVACRDHVVRVDADGRLFVPDLGVGGFGSPFFGGVVADAEGGVFVSVRFEHVVLRVTANGASQVVAGRATLDENPFGDGFILIGNPGNGPDGVAATAAGLDHPAGLAVHDDGALLIADQLNRRVRRVDPDTGVMTTFAGSGALADGAGGDSDGDGGDATLAALEPFSLATDPDGRTWITDLSGQRLRVVDAAGTISTALPTGDGERPFVLVRDGAVAPRRSTILFGTADARRIVRVFIDGDDDGVAVVGHGDVSAATQRPAPTQNPGRPFGLVHDDDGLVIVSNSVLRVVDGVAHDLPLAVDFLDTVTDAELAPDGTIILAEKGASRVVRYDPRSGAVEVVAGRGEAVFDGDGGPAVSAGLIRPQGVAVAADGTIFIADLFAARVRRVDATTGLISTVAGSGPVAFNAGFAGDGGPATAARFNGLNDVDVLADGSLVVADSGNRRLRRIVPGGAVTTIAGTGAVGLGGDGGQATSAQLDTPVDLAVGDDGTIFVTDEAGAVRAIGNDGVIRRVLGNGTRAPLASGDGGPATAAILGDVGCCFNGTADLALHAGILYVGTAGLVRGVSLADDTVATVVGEVDPTGLGPAPTTRIAGLGQVAVIDDTLLLAGAASGRLMRGQGGPAGIVDVVFGSPRGRTSPVGARHHLPLPDLRAVAHDGVDRAYVGSAAGGLVAIGVGADTVTGPSDRWPTTEVLPDGALDSVVAIAATPSRLVVVDEAAHCVRTIDRAGADYTLIADTIGRCGVRGVGREGRRDTFLLDRPTGVAVADGVMYIADAGHQRIWRVDGDDVTAVLGDGSASNAGEGAPSSHFPVRDPFGLLLDRYGNLWVAAGETLRVLPGVDGSPPRGDGPVRTALGRPPRTGSPERELSCLRGIAPIAGSDDVIAVDACLGAAVLVRAVVTP